MACEWYASVVCEHFVSIVRVTQYEDVDLQERGQRSDRCLERFDWSRQWCVDARNKMRTGALKPP